MAIPDPPLVLALVAATAAGAALGLMGLRARAARRARRARGAARPAGAAASATPGQPGDARWPPAAVAEADGGLIGLRATPWGEATPADGALLEAMRRHLARALPEATVLVDPATGRLLLAVALPPEGGGEDALHPAEPGLVAFDLGEWAAFERDPAVQAALRVQVARARRRGRACLASGDGSPLQRLGFELAGVTLQADADTLGALDALDARRGEAP